MGRTPAVGDRKEAARVVDELGNIRRRALEVLRVVYLEALNSDADVASMRHIGPQLTPPLDPDDFGDQEEFRRLAQYLAGKGYIEDWADGYLMFTITRRGRALAEGEAPARPQVTSHTYNIGGDAYGSVFGSQQRVEMNVSFDMRTAQAELQRTREDVARRGGPDTEQLQELLDEVEDLLKNGRTLDRGRFSKWIGVLQRNGWIAGPVASLLMNWATQAAQ